MSRLPRRPAAAADQPAYPTALLAPALGLVVAAGLGCAEPHGSLPGEPTAAVSASATPAPQAPAPATAAAVPQAPLRGRVRVDTPAPAPALPTGPLMGTPPAPRPQP